MLYEMLGIDRNEPAHQLAMVLVGEDNAMLDQLINHARQKGISQADIARKMGVSVSSVALLEQCERDPHLSTLRRYALSVGAYIHHEVRLFGTEAPDSQDREATR